MSSIPVNPPPIDLVNIAKNLRVLADSFVELYRGIREGRLPWNFCFSFGSLVGLFILFRIDLLIFKLARLSWLYPLHPWSHRIYLCLAMMSGFYLWGLRQAYRREQRTKNLTNLFLNAKLQSATGALPSIVADVPIDKSSYRMTLLRNGLNIQNFRDASASIASNLGAYIDDIEENRENGTIDIFYSYGELSRNIELAKETKLPANTFIAGYTRLGEIRASLEDVPHLLIAGASGNGKSTFLRQFITTLYLNNKNLRLTLIDLKGGLEFQLFSGLKRISIMTDVPSASIALTRAVKMLEDRMKLLHMNDCKDIEAFMAIPEDKRKYSEGWNKETPLDRHLIAVDENYDLFLVAPGSSSEHVQKARAAANTIAQKGRAVGIHLVTATQRPDRMALDPQTKANLAAKICFRMENNASSMTVLDNGKAANLPKIAGRAIWQCGSENVEIQTPNMSVENAKALLPADRGSQKTSKSDDSTDKTSRPKRTNKPDIQNLV